MQTTRYGHQQSRKPAQQAWAVGEQVKVGFLSLRITAKTPRGWRLVNKDATKHYEFEPHIGLFAVDPPQQAQFIGMSDDDEPMAVYRLPFTL